MKNAAATGSHLVCRLLPARVRSTELLQTLRALKTDEGKVDILPKDDGGFVAIDRANGGNSFTLTPPVQRRPLRENGTVHVQRYEEDNVSQTGDDWSISVEFARDANREDTPSSSEAPQNGAVFDFAFPATFGPSEWGITTRYGTIATERVTATEVSGTGEGGVQRFELTATLTFAQAHAFEAALSRLGAARIREIPDAPNVAVDDSSDDAATVTIDAPNSQDTVADGEYVVLAWQSERVSDAYQRVTLTVAKT